jgi:hypothetical protein
MSTSHQQGVRLTKPQIEYLQREAERLDITVSEVIRRIIDQYREEKGKQS